MHQLLIDSLRRRIQLCEQGDEREVLTSQALSDAEELMHLMHSPMPGDQTWRVDALSVIIDFALCLSRHLPDDKSAQYYELAVRQMIPLLRIDPGRVRRVFWSQIRRIVSEEIESSFGNDSIMASVAIRERLVLLEWFVEQDRSSGRPDAAALSLVGRARWRRFEIIAGDEHMLELDPAAEAFEELDRQRQAEVPVQIREYLSHLRQYPSPVAMFADAKLVLGGEKLRAVGRAVLQLRRNLARAAPEAWPRAVVDLCRCLLARYGAVHLRDDLDEALERLSGLMAGELADDLFADAARAFGLGMVYRGDLDGCETDLTRGLEITAAAWLKLGTEDPVAGRLLSELMIAACTHAQHTRASTAIDRALEITEPQDQGHRERDRAGEVAHIRMLLLGERFKITGQIPDLDKAIAEGHRSTSAIPRGDPAAAERWHQLARVEHDRFHASGDIADLNAAIKDIRVPLRYMEKPDPALSEELALWQVQRFQLTGDREDIREAAASLIKLWRDNKDPRPYQLFNITSIGLQAATFPADGVRAAIQLCESMIRQPLPPDGPSRCHWLNLLSKAIHALPDETRTEQELALSIQAAGMAVQTGIDDDDHDSLVHDLVAALIDRGLPEDLDRAVWEAQQALGRSRDWTEESVLLSALAAAYLKRFELAGATPDQLAAIDAFRRIATSSGSPALRRGDAAYYWAREATKRGDYAHACEAYQIIVQLIAQQARRPGRPEQRNAWLARWVAAARNGAACAIRAGNPGIALALLEHGRAVNVSQSLQRQADIAAVRSRRPDLAERMTQLAQQIEAFAKRDRAEIYRDYMEATFSLVGQMFESRPPADFEWNEPDWLDLTRAQKWSEDVLEEAASNDSRLTLALQWDQLMDELGRQLPELPICVPPAVDDLIAAVSGAAAVMLNVSEVGCDALIVRDGTLTIVPLPDLTDAAVFRVCGQLYTSIFRIESGDRSAEARGELRKVMSGCLSWLWDTVCAAVLNAFDIDGPPADGQPWPRIWWCPTGYLAMLPIHAAGHYGPDGQGPCVIDRVVSSYTTTLTALARARHAANTDPNPGRSRRLRAISVPEIPGASALRHTDLELAAVRPWIPADQFPLIGDKVTIDSFYQGLQRYDWLHIACHGTPPIPGQQPAQLYLSNNVLTVNRLAWETTVNSELAYLSACHTATGSSSDPDEAEHLAGAFQATGYQHVIGTLWGAADRAAATVASEFYNALAADQRSGPPRAAEALHHAIRACKRAHPRQPFLWAPFVHLGP